MKKELPNCNKTFDKNEIKKLITWFLSNYGSIRTSILLDKLKNIGFRYSTVGGISLSLEDIKIPAIKEILINNTEQKIKKNLLNLKNGKINILKYSEKNMKLWNNINELLKEEVLNNFREQNLLNPVYMMTFSGARGNISQVRQLAGMRGLISTSQGQIMDLPIKSNLKEGLKITEYFISCYGARKGLVDTALKTANSGYLTRRLIYCGQTQIIKRPNCNSKKGIIIFALKENKKNYNFASVNLIGRTLNKTIKNKQTQEILFSKGQDLCKYIVKKIINFKKIYINSPLTCNLNYGLCQMCYGWNLGNGRMVELGETVGILAAQSIGEPGTQLTMRTFHTGGVFAGETTETIYAPHSGTIYYNSKNDGKKVKSKYGEKAFYTEREKKILIIENCLNKSYIKIPKNSLIFSKPKKNIYKKQILAETIRSKKINKKIKDNNSSNELKEIKSKISGLTIFELAKKKIKNSYQKEETTMWIINGNLILFKSFFHNLVKKSTRYKQKKIHKTLLTTKLNPLNLNKTIQLNLNEKYRNKKTKRYEIIKKILKKNQMLLTKKATEKNLSLNKCIINIGEFLKINKKFSLNKKNNHNCIIKQRTNKTITVKKSNPYVITKNSILKTTNKSLIKKNSKIYYTQNKKQKIDDIVQGLPRVEELLEAKKTSNLKIIKNNPHEQIKKYFRKFSLQYNNLLATKKTISKIQLYLIKKIQKVYKSQGVTIADKHIETIIKQMTSKVIISKQGDSKFLIGEILELKKVEKINLVIKNKIQYEPILIGISKVSLNNESFISEASFQETTKVLSKSAIEGKTDWLYGLKENIILSNLIPAGTGYTNKQY